MNVAAVARVLSIALLMAIGSEAFAAQQKVRITGVIRDESNAITLPGIAVEVPTAPQPAPS